MARRRRSGGADLRRRVERRAGGRCEYCRAPQVGAGYRPRTDRWEEHFAWLDGCRLIQGSTPTGRATVEALDINHELRRQARGYWFEAGLLPG